MKHSKIKLTFFNDLWIRQHANSNREALPQAEEKRYFLKAERGWKEEIISKERIISGKVAFLEGMEGTVQETISLVLTSEKFNLEIPGWLVKGYIPGGLKLQLD